MTDTSPALPPLTPSPLVLPPAPVSPDVEVTAPVEDVDDPGVARLLEAFRVLQVQHGRVLAHESATRGLGTTDTRLLLHLAAAEPGGTTPKQAGEQLELSTGATTSLLDRLERHGHLERRPNPDDRRSILVHLTPSGTAVAREVAATWAAAFRDAVAPAARAGVALALEGVGDALERRHRAATAS
ncbi:MarR family transcriptional regulator [Curtobacterium sp. RHCJP20]|uniref:MarR family transcriptional regulator n=1 Tax=Curtobacterium subtropicum TaxID=3055138 RepID=A0ABT7TCR7_9MICO|nr:MarR family transcriptional regulator [Curtobacterium subtropicum]MDM7887367.1 MarR family transcriptional regulator [Curtobacterium subtropicum]